MENESQETSTNSVIHPLPSSISNKIAAGEVVQRPSSVVKELIDNAVDAGAQTVEVTIEKAGRTLIEVKDDGCGMSSDDLRPCFLRHATSKINSVEDLSRIMTLGFRGEAMASIASVSQINVKTKRVEDDNGWELELWGGEERRLDPAAADNGTTVSVRNLFFNVPARRAFLKTDATEFRHILITFQQAALSTPEISFYLKADGEEIYHLPAQSLANRIASIFGKSYRASLIPVEEKTSIVDIYGYLIDPKMAKKTRGEQFLFVNNRPFMHRHLNYVILDTYNNWLRDKEYPFYALFYKIDPEQVDVNVHPSKLEVKFEDEKTVSQLTRSVVTKGLNEHFHVPDMDHLDSGSKKANTGGFDDFGFGDQTASSAGSGTPGGAGNAFGNDRSGMHKSRPPIDGDEAGRQLYGQPETEGSADTNQAGQTGMDMGKVIRQNNFWQIHDQYIMSQTLTGISIIDQHAAHKRIIYERALSEAESGLPSTQQLLFPQTLEFSASDFQLLKQLEPEIERLGFNIQLLSGNTAMILGVPSDIQSGDEYRLLGEMLQQYQTLNNSLSLSKREKLALAYANKTAIRKGKRLGQEEMESLIDQLFSCKHPYFDPLNKPTLLYIPLEEIQSRFQSKKK